MDYFGYHLASTLGGLTPEQALFVHMGRGELEERLNKVEKNNLGKYKR